MSKRPKILTFKQQFKMDCIANNVLEKDVIEKLGMNRTKFYTLLSADAFDADQRKEIEGIITELEKQTK